MTETTLNQGETLLQKEEAGGSHWLRRTALVVFSLALLASIGVVFTRTIAARVPQQRATLEKLIADRTGLEVRFDNVHFAWNLDGTSAVFTRVELTDPKANRVRVQAPELRVKFDTWDFLRHQQYSFGHVTLASPDIEIIGDPEPPGAQARGAAVKGALSPVANGALSRSVDGAPSRSLDDAPSRDEAALLRRYTSWMEVMPTGRIEVEGARVHLRRRGDRRAHHTFTLSQAVVSRGANSFNAWGTLLLAQDVGQSLFVSAKIDGLSAGSAPSADLRVIARRIFLDKLALQGIDGRGTFDARLQIRNGRLESATWQASAREIALEGGGRFDHLIVNGRLSRAASDILLDFDDLQLTRGARLEHTSALAARIALEPGAVRIARTTVRAERVPFMAAELFAALAARPLSSGAPSGAWAPVAGELHEVSFDSGAPGMAPGWTFSARVSGAELARADHARLAQLAVRVRADARAVTLELDPALPAALRVAGAAEPRVVSFGGSVAFSAQSPRQVTLTDVAAQIGASRIAADGEWRAGHGRPLGVRVTDVDRALVGELWQLVAGAQPAPAILTEISDGSVSGDVQLMPARDAAASPADLDLASVDWARSRGKLGVEALTSHGEPRLAAARGVFDFARGAARLRLSSGRVDDLDLTGARLDWPRSGEPRLHAALSGTFDSALMRRALAGQGLDRLHGAVALEADARGEQELRQPARWRLTARVGDASLALAAGVPAIEKIAGSVRYSDGALRALDLDGQWLGGPVRLEGRRAGARAALAVAVNGVADAAPLLRALGQPEAASRVSGALAWSGTAQRAAAVVELEGQEDTDAWHLTLASNLVGVESRLAEPFDKARARALPLEAELRVDAAGIRVFSLAGRDISVRAELRDDITTAKFALLGITGEARYGAAPRAAAQVHIDRIELERVPAVFAAAHVLLAGDGTATLRIGDLRLGSGKGDPGVGALHASLARAADGVRFDLETDAGAVHRIAARGSCAATGGRCRADFTLDTPQLALLVRGMRLPPEWPTQSLHARGELSWPDSAADFTRALAGAFEIEAQGADSAHQLFASATLADGEISIANLQGAGPEPTQVFRGNGRLGLLARDYDLRLEYERVSTLAANAVPTPARARLARAWNALRGSAARRGWAEAPEIRYVQWHGTWDGDLPPLPAERAKGDAALAR